MADPLDEALEALGPTSVQPQPKGLDPLDDALKTLGDGEAPEAPEARPVGAVDNVLSNAYARIADMVGFPVEVVNELLGHAGKNFLEKPGNAQRAIRDAMKEMGLVSPNMNSESLSGKIGAMFPDAMLAMVGIRTAGPRLSAVRSAEEVTATSGRVPGSLEAGSRQAVKDLGRFAVDKPAHTLVGTVAGVPGMAAGKEYGGPVGRFAGDAADAALGTESLGPVGEKIGETVGEMAGGLVTGVAGIEGVRRTGIPLTRSLHQRLSGDPNAGRMGLPMSYHLEREKLAGVGARETMPIVAGKPVDAIYARQFAAEQLSGEVEAIDRQITRSINSISTSGASNATMSDRFRSTLENVEQKASGVVDRFWGRVDRNVRIHTDALRAWAEDVLTHPNQRVAAGNFPNDRARQILQIDDDGAGSVRLSMLAGRDSIRSQVLKEAKEAGGSAIKQPNRELQARLYQLADLIQSEIAAQNPNNVPLQQAAAMSRIFNDRFTRGPLADILSRDYDNAPRILPEETVDKLLGYLRGVRQVYEARRPLTPAAGRMGTMAPGTGGVMTAGNEEAAMVGQLDEAVRQQYVNAAREAGAKAAMRGSPEAPAEALGGAQWLQKNAEKIDRMTSLTRRLQQVAQETTELANERAYITKGALAQYTARDPEASARAILGSTDPRRDVTKLMSSFGADGPHPDIRAVEGLRRTLVEELFATSKSFVDIKETLAEPRLNEAFKTLFSTDPKAFERLQRLVATAEILEKGQPSAKFDAILRQGYNLMAKIVGLHIGRAIAHGTSSGSAGALALPAYWARVMQAQVGQMAEKEATVKLLANAVFDPVIESGLLRRIPSGITEGERAFYNGRRQLTHAQALIDRLHDETVNGVHHGAAFMRAGRHKDPPPQQELQ